MSERVEYFVRNRYGETIPNSEGCRDAETAGWWEKFCNTQSPKNAPHVTIKRTITEEAVDA